MMKKSKLLLFALLTTVFIALVTPLAFAAGNQQTATLSVYPFTGIIEYPTYTIDINISEVTYLWAVRFQLDFNTPNDCLEFESVEAGNLLPGSIVRVAESTDSINVLVKTSTPPDPSTTVNGSGSVAKIIFNLKDTAEVGMTSNLLLPVSEADATTILPDGTPEYIEIMDTYSGSVEVAHLITDLNINVPATAKVDTPTAMSAALKDGVGKPVEGLTIDYYIRSDTVWNPIGSNDTDASGVASVDYAFTSVGEFDVKAEFSGTAKYAPSNDTDTILVTWSESTLTLTVSPIVVKVDETITLSAALEDKDSGNSLHNFKIYFYIYADDEWKPIGDEFTDLDGVASVDYAPTAAGTFEVNATYWGSLEYASSSDTHEILVVCIETSLTIDVPATAKVETPTTLSATLKDEEARPVGGEVVDFYVRSDTVWNEIGSDETDVSGIASIGHTPTDAGTFQIKAAYGGSTKYAESSDKDMLTVSLLTTTLDLYTPASARVEDTIILVAALKDENGNPIADSIVDYYISSGAGWSKVGLAPTDTGGVASMDYTPTEAGTFKLKAVYEGTRKYAGSSSEEVTLEVSGEEEHLLSFLLDAELTILDILFWVFVVVSFLTLVSVYIWRKRRVGKPKIIVAAPKP